MLRFKETPIQFLIRVNAQEIAIRSDPLAALLLLPSIATIFVLSSSKNVSINAEATYFTKFCSSLVIKDFSLLFSHGLLNFSPFFSHGLLCMAL